MKRLVACVRLVGALAVTLLMLTLVHAAPAPVRDPVLRIETGTHLATITRISADSSGRWLVTASEDKTARLWDARSGAAVSILRPPIGAESVGALYAAAISPDGRTVALGGNSDFGDNTHVLHLFDRASASVPPKSTLAGLEAPLTQLAWSPDNQMLVIGLRQEGLRVFRRNLQFVGADPEYNEAIFGAAFATDGRLAVAALDGFIRIYRIGKNGLERIARLKAPGGKPYALAFSPDDRVLAVGYQDRARVDLLVGSDLNPMHQVDLGDGNLGRVAWSPDGTTLFAAGSYSSKGRFPVLAFGNRGTAAAREVGSFSNTVLSLAALPGGKVAAASAEPAWAIFGTDGQRLAGSQAQSADFRDSDFRVNADGSLVAFRYRAGDANQVFDLASGSLKSGAATDRAMPPLQNGEPRVDNWKNSTTPKIGGRPLTLKPGEVSRSLAIQAQDRSFVIGTEWFLRRYARDGAPLWEHRVTAPAWVVNISGDGRWVVAGLGDGSIRWLRARDGTEQLALFPHTDKIRWIAWTPSGYYDTSVGGENLVGWHLNRAFNQSADFFSAGRFRDRLYRPDVIQKLLVTGDEQEALKAAQADLAALEVANAEPPPATAKTSVATVAAAPPAAVTTLAPGNDIAEVLPPIIELRSEPVIETGATTLLVRYEIRSPSDAPVSGIKARVNGKLVRNLTGKGLRAVGVQEVEVPLPTTDAEIQIFAENRHGKSDPVTVKVSRSAASGAVPQTAGYYEKYDKLYLLIVGVSKYPDPWTLNLASKDARDFSHHMARQTGKLYNATLPKLLIDEQASRQNILDGLKWLRESVGEKDAGVVFFAGHGMNIGRDYFFIPGDPGALPAKGEIKNDAEFTAWQSRNGGNAWVSGDEIAKTLLSLKGRSAFFVDTCHSGNLAKQANMTGQLNTLDEEKGVIIFASSTGKEFSQEDDSWGNGAFTKAIIEGIKGGADKDKTGMIRPTYLSAYVNDRVRTLTRNEQRPVIFTVGIDDPIASKTQ